MRTANASRRAPRGAPIVLAIVLVSWLVWLGWFVTAPDTNANGQCEGLFFGCRLTPHDSAAFVGSLVLLPLSLLVVAVTGVVRLVRVRRGSPRTVWDLVLGVLLAAAVVAWVVGSLAGAF
ncbi:hypothetical protein ACOCJ4_06020 [Knoellia sp. CPCC 206435]|uniref:hypothetical protein n=1 Tax=Knoellia terrae TaxID=3404797 RepID=UPI003B428C53